MQKENYKSIKIKSDSYKRIKLLAVKIDIPITRLIDLMLESFLAEKK